MEETVSAVSWPGPEEGCPVRTIAVALWRLVGWAEEGLYVVGWAEEGLCVGSNGCGVGGAAEVCERLVRTMTEGLGDSRLFSVCPRKIEA